MTAVRIADAVWKRKYAAASAVVISAALSLDTLIAGYSMRKNTRIAAGASHGVRAVTLPTSRTMLLSLETMVSNTSASYPYLPTTSRTRPSGTIFLGDPGQEARPPTG